MNNNIVSFPLQRPDIIKLSDINTLLELECLSAKQLKNLLNTNRVDYKGCIERCELLDKASRLWEQYKRSKTGNAVWSTCLQDTFLYLNV